jgi:hypothetical protein
MTSPQDLLHVALVGIGATAVLDTWFLVLKRLGVQTQPIAHIGRWVGHVFRGRPVHAAIAKAEPIPHEQVLGWLAHYAIGVAFAVLLVGLQGLEWLRRPSWAPAVAVGVCTVAAPLFVMQPAMGAGFAASKTPTPWRIRLRSLANHTVFGLGLYLSAAAMAAISAA